MRADGPVDHLAILDLVVHSEDSDEWIQGLQRWVKRMARK